MEVYLNQSGIYAIISPSGKLYVGSAVLFRKRWAVHQHKLRKGGHHCRALQRAYHKYGAELEYRVLEICSKEELISREQFYIDSYARDMLYNSSYTAGSSLGVTRSAETRQKLRAANLGKKASEETRAKISAASLGRKRSADTCARIGEIHRGKAVSLHVCEKLASVRKSNNRSGFSGVCWNPKSEKWRARITLLGRRVDLGQYETADLAGKARQNFNRILKHYSHS